MVKSEQGANGFATVGLENYWSPWFKKWQLEKLGFQSIDAIEVRHKAKHKDEPFTIFLMWMSRVAKAKPPSWDKEKLFEGVNFCIAHPLYCPKAREGPLLELSQEKGL
jgi:hypothetical protein